VVLKSEGTMRGPKPRALELNDEERQGLVALVRRHTTPQQIVLRARVVLTAADGRNNAEIARQLGVNVAMVRLWRTRWLGVRSVAPADLGVEERLSDAPRSGAPARIRAEQGCRIVALACAAPRHADRPISHWTGRAIADELVRRGIVDRISPRPARRLRKRGSSNRSASATG